jgi:hypothetical protein
VVHATEKRAKVEEKPEVRKAGGVYYTPEYIVRYIVKETVGKLIEGKTPAQIVEMAFADIACGSGSFLLEVYSTLIEYHTRWYNENPTKAKKADVETRDGKLVLSLKKLQEILTNSIYGVDIDFQATEVTQLSLYLRLLEDVTLTQLHLFKEKVLPDLRRNIVCGNSLIEPDIEAQTSLFGSEEHTPSRLPSGHPSQEGTQITRGKTKHEHNTFPSGEGNRRSTTRLVEGVSNVDHLKPMRFTDAFPDVMKRGGFDAIVGNPPYGFHQIHDDNLKPYFKSHFQSSGGSYEHYFLFYERSLKLLRRNGLHGFIVPVTWLTIPSAKSLREFILDNYSIKEIDWLPELVFKNAQVNTLVSITSNTKGGQSTINIYDSLGFQLPPRATRVYDQDKFISDNHYIGIFGEVNDDSILAKLQTSTVLLKIVSQPCSGYNPYEVGKGKAPDGRPHKKETVESRPYHSDKQISNEWKPEIGGRDLSRYRVSVTGRRWIKYGRGWLRREILTISLANGFLSKR